VNSLVILPSECVDSCRAALLGPRARYALDTHGVVVGQPIKIAVLGLGRGEGRVSSVDHERIDIDFKIILPAMAPAPFSLIVGVSRPQTIKKVVQASVMFGAQELHFVRSEKGDKSYLQSRSLDEDQIQEECLKALEQIWDSRVPNIQVHRAFDHFMRHKVAAMGSTDEVAPVRLIAHPDGAPTAQARHKQSSSQSFIVAIGPERGWSDEEVSRFEEAGFSRVSLGERVVRVELALVYLLGKLSV
jgi:16S rRNA (uracil1498-N3)-methyltransferase